MSRPAKMVTKRWPPKVVIYIVDIIIIIINLSEVFGATIFLDLTIVVPIQFHVGNMKFSNC